MSTTEPTTDGVPFDERCYFCGVPYSQESVDGGRCLACLSMICGETEEGNKTRDWWSYITGFLVHRPPEEGKQHPEVRAQVKKRLFGFIYGTPLPSGEGFSLALGDLLLDPTPDRVRALAALGQYWFGYAMKRL